jgi:lambda family phage tail tape measure protein
MAEQAAHEIASAEEAAIAIANLNAFYSEGNTSIREKQELDKTSLTRAQEMFKLERQAVYLKAEELQQEKELLEQQWKYADAVEAIMSMKNLDSMSRMEALAREEKLNEKALQNILERTRILKAEKSGGVFDGFLFRAQTFGKDMETSFEAGAKGFDSLMGSMTKALDEFVTTGKLNFGDFAKSVIKDMLAIQFRASANNLFSMLAKAVFSPSVSLAEPFGGPKADGGPVESNSSYLVGERGPELFVPRSAGAIVPNHSMAMMGGSTNITNYNIQAIDTKSFEDRILGSSKAVWAANAYGAKNLSLGRGRT